MEWLQNAQSVTFIRVLGAGDGRNRLQSGDVKNAGFTVGEEQPNHATLSGALGANPYANVVEYPFDPVVIFTFSNVNKLLQNLSASIIPNCVVSAAPWLSDTTKLTFVVALVGK